MDRHNIEMYESMIDRDLIPVLKDIGCLKADMEIVGLLLYKRYKGSNEKLDWLNDQVDVLMSKVDALLVSVQGLNNDNK